MLSSITRSDAPIGIDLSGSRAHVLQLAPVPAGMGVVASARIDRARVGLPADESSASPDALVTAIARRVQAGGFRGRRCVLTLPDNTIRLRTVRHPLMPEQELASVVGFDAMDQLGFTGEDPGQIGWLRTGEIVQGDERRVEVLYFGLPVRTVEEMAYAFASAGLEPVAIEPRFVSCMRAMTRHHQRAGDAEIVQLGLDVNERSTMILITRGAELVFAKLIEIGGDHFDRAAQQRLGLELDVIREMREHRASVDDTGSQGDRIDRAMFDAVRPVLADIAHEASLCLRHYAVTFRGARPERTLLMGSEANEPMFTQIVSEAIGVDTQVFQPLHGIGTESTIGGSAYGPAWAGAAGAACREMLRKSATRKRYQRRVAQSQAESAKGRAA